jgi:hypothetical protein
MFKKFDGVITPDFSIGEDMPLIMQIWQIYRNRVLGYRLQNEGVNIVPHIRWHSENTYDFAFEGLSKGGTVAISTLGVVKDKYFKYLFGKGLRKMLDVIEPETILCHGTTPEDVFSQVRNKGINLITIPSLISNVHRKKEVYNGGA